MHLFARRCYSMGFVAAFLLFVSTFVFGDESAESDEAQSNIEAVERGKFPLGHSKER